MRSLRFCIVIIALALGTGQVRAQERQLIAIDIWNIYSSATGNSNAQAKVLWTESFASSAEGEELFSAIESYTGNPDEEIAKLITQLNQLISDFQKTREEIAEGKGSYAGLNMSAAKKKEYLDEYDAQIRRMKEQLAYYSSMSVPAGADPRQLLERILSHSANHKVYHGVLSLGKGLWAVSESLNEDGPGHTCLGGWGVIDSYGWTVADFKYDIILESDQEHGIIKYGTCSRGKGTRYGLLKFDGSQALPCEYEQLYLSKGNYIAAVLPGAAHAYLYDWNMKRLSTADICYTEPWTRAASGLDVTYYPAIDRNGKVGVYDDTGRLVVPFIYDRCYSDGQYWIGVKGPFPKKVSNFGLSYDHIDSTHETRYDITTWK